MKIVKNKKDPWWTTFQVTLFLLLAISFWSVMFCPTQPQQSLIQGK